MIPREFLALPLLLAAILAGCNGSNNQKEDPLARAHDAYLYPSDLADIFPGPLSPQDSLHLIQAYTDRWVRRQLMLYQAERNLSEPLKNVAQELEDYRSSLLIFRYEQEYILQRLDQEITEAEIEEFHRQNPNNFILSEALVKALFIQLPRAQPYAGRIRQLYRSTVEEDIKVLDNLAHQAALKYDYFDDRWVPFSRIAAALPLPIPNADELLARQRHIEMEDGEHLYLVSIRDVWPRGQVSPLEYERENIRNIILNRRKLQLIRDLETNIYNDARNHNLFTIFIE